jgi:hypothetical protein
MQGIRPRRAAVFDPNGACVDLALPPAIIAPLFIGICLVSGIVLLVATGRGWQGPRWSDAWDALGIQRLIYRAAGGREAYYRWLGVVFLVIGVLALLGWLAAG